MNALGFGRCQGERSPVDVAATPEAEAEVTNETVSSGGEHPVDGGEEPIVWPTFEPLAMEEKSKGDEPVDEAKAIAQEEESDDEDACDADGVALRGDDAGPDFLASEEEGEDVAEDWENELMVGDDFEPLKAGTSAEAWKSRSELPEPAAAFPWLRASLDAVDEAIEESHEVVEAEAVEGKEDPVNFESKQTGESLLPKSEWNHYLGVGGLPVDGDSLSALSKGLTKSPESPTEETVADPVAKEPEVDVLDDLLLEEEPDEKPLVATWPTGGIEGATVPLDELPGEGSQPQPQAQLKSQLNREPVMPNSESSPEPSPDFIRDEDASRQQIEEPMDFEADLLVPNPSPEPPSPIAEEPSAALSEAVEEQPKPTLPWLNATPDSSSEPINSPDEAPLTTEAVDAADASKAPVEAEKKMESEPLIAAAVVSEEVIDLACPQCGDGLSLRREHLGIAGHCVWCQAPLIAAASGLDGVVRVFLLKTESQPVETSAEVAAPEPDREVPAAESPVEETVPSESPSPVVASPSPWTESALIQSEAESPTEAPQPAMESTPVETPETSEPAQPPVEEVDPKAALIAERAAAVQQALTGAIKRQNPEPKADEAEVAAKPVSTESKPAFAWANPSSEEVEAEKSEEKEAATSAGKTETEDSVKKTNSPFDWKPPVSNPEVATPEVEEKAETPSLANHPFGEIGKAVSLASSMTLKNKPSSDDSNEKNDSAESETPASEAQPFQNLSKFLSDPTSAPKVSSLMPEPEQPVAEPTEVKAAGKSDDTWSDPDKKEKSDPFGGGFGKTDVQALDESKSAGPSAFESSIEGESKPARASLFTSGAAAKPKEEEAAPSEEESVIAEKEGESSPEKRSIEEIPAAKSELATPAPTKSTKEKIKREVDTSAPASKGKGMGRLVKMSIWVLVVLGLLSGAGLMAMYSDQIKAKLTPILEKVMPSKEEVDDHDAAEAAIPMSESSSAVSSDSDSSAASNASSPATADSKTSPSSTSPTIKTGLSTVPVAPEIVPEKKSLFGGGPLMINDNGGESDSSE
ncbi:MAG: hypothetical protein KDN20_00030 [Verrucomicrobiae bacterium]|nr:hypothetical protein [Verrucomicrobiae bacterium]